MRALREDPEQAVNDSLWDEALWGLGLIGTVLILVATLVALFWSLTPANKNGLGLDRSEAVALLVVSPSRGRGTPRHVDQDRIDEDLDRRGPSARGRQVRGTSRAAPSRGARR